MESRGIRPSILAYRVLAQGGEETLSRRRLALRRTAAVLRGLADDLVNTDMETDELAAATDELAAIAARFNRAAPKSVYEGFREAAVSGKRWSRFSTRPRRSVWQIRWPRQSGPRSPTTASRAEVSFGAAYEGTPGFVHGGYIAAVFDDVLGSAQVFAGAPGVAGTLTVVYRARPPLHTPLVVNARFDRREGRKLITIGEMHAGETLIAEAAAVYIEIDLSGSDTLTSVLARRLRVDHEQGEH